MKRKNKKGQAIEHIGKTILYIAILAITIIGIKTIINNYTG